ncbi:delta(1)-pyrroline-2-carboxylate reductase family protein [Cupriavidus basilensis]
MVADAHTGRRLALLDGPTVTGRRTAAVSLLAAQTFAPEPGGELLIIGAGVQAQTHLEAFVAGLAPRRVWLHSRTAAKAEALAAHARTLGVEAQTVADVSAVLPRVSMVVTVTSSLTPVLPDLDSGLWRDEHFIAAVGAFRPEMCELPPALCQAASAHGRLLGRHIVRHRGGGGRPAASAGIDWATVQPFEQAILAADALRARKGSPLVFKSVGYALWDLAACVLASAGPEAGNPAADTFVLCFGSLAGRWTTGIPLSNRPIPRSRIFGRQASHIRYSFERDFAVICRFYNGLTRALG